MNYYKHHIGDYDAATAHLSWDEDMAYSRLLRMYYRTEQAIPADMAKACRLIRANSKAERAAVETVLGEFFALGEDGWHQKRCDEELVKATERADANRENGNRGGRPSKPKPNPEITQLVSEPEPRNNLPRASAPASTTPLATSHEPEERDDATASSATHEASDERSHANGLEPGHRDLPAKAGTRGTRCPADWRPDEANRRRCIEVGLDLEPAIIEFRNYWCAIPGSKGLKLDWQATFYNRCSELAGRRASLAGAGQRQAGKHPTSVIEAAQDVIAAIRHRQ